MDQLMAANVDLICHLSFIAVVVCQDSQQLADNYEGYTRVKYIHGTMCRSMCVHFPRGLATTVHVNVRLRYYHINYIHRDNHIADQTSSGTTNTNDLQSNYCPGQ